jgi:hypothetical protein
MDIIYRKKSRRNPKTTRPLKKLLSSSPPSSSEKTSVHHHRYLFLKKLEEHYKLPPFKRDLWSGTALHLLLLTKKITPDMYQAAILYEKLVHRNFTFAPTISRVSLDENLVTTDRKNKTYGTPQFREDDRKSEGEERLWRDLNKILIKTNSKTLLDTLLQQENLGSMQEILGDKKKIDLIRNGLVSLEKRVKS